MSQAIVWAKARILARKSLSSGSNRLTESFVQPFDDCAGLREYSPIRFDGWHKRLWVDLAISGRFLLPAILAQVDGYKVVFHALESKGNAGSDTLPNCRTAELAMRSDHLAVPNVRATGACPSISPLMTSSATTAPTPTGVPELDRRPDQIGQMYVLTNGAVD